MKIGDKVTFKKSSGYYYQLKEWDYTYGIITVKKNSYLDIKIISGCYTNTYCSYSDLKLYKPTIWI